MFLHFSKHHGLSIQYNYIQINFQLRPLVSIVTDVEVSPATTPSGAAKFPLSTYASSSYG